MKNILIILVALSFGLIGCADTGNKSLKYAAESNVRAQIKKDVKTKDQIKAIFGSTYYFFPKTMHGSSTVPSFLSIFR